MNAKASHLARRLRAFADEVIDFTAGCSDKDWNKRCVSEDWSVGVTARHIGAGHFNALALARMIVDGVPLPGLTRDKVTEMANTHARRHAECSREEVLDVLTRRAAELIDYVAGLSDEALDRSGRLELAGGVVTARQLIEAVILKSAGEHLASMRAACGR